MANRRATPPTHPTVWAGLGLAAVGLLLAIYAYTGTRVYDVTFALVAIVGGVLALGGILVAAWGRAVMSSRASRARRSTIQRDLIKIELALEEQAPTVAEPRSKKKFVFPRPSLPKLGRKEASPVESGKSALFAFKRPASPAPPAVVVVEPVVERLTLKCPQCASQFTAEGIRPITAVCPQCSFSAQV